MELRERGEIIQVGLRDASFFFSFNTKTTAARHHQSLLVNSAAPPPHTRTKSRFLDDTQAEGANVTSSKMKEAKGQKAYDSFEIVARTLLFRPTFTVLSPADAGSVSSVHALVGPVLTLLEGCENAR